VRNGTCLTPLHARETHPSIARQRIDSFLTSTSPLKFLCDLVTLFPQMGSTSIPMFWYWPRTTPLLTHVGITRLMHTGPFQRSDQCLLVLLGTDCIPIPRFDHGIVQLLVHAGTRPADACSESDPWVWSRTPWSKPTSSSTRPTSAPASLPRACWPASLILVHIDQIRMSKLGGSNIVEDTA